jgi:predicted aspartyl protease
MGESRLFIPRRPTRVGNIVVQVTVTNLIEPAHHIDFEGLVDTGTFGLVLPRAWKERLGPLAQSATVEVETADQRVVTGELSGPVWVQIAGCRPIPDEVVFMDMQPGRHEAYEPLVGYTILERCGLVIDMVTHRLVARKYFDAKVAGRRTLTIPA